MNHTHAARVLAHQTVTPEIHPWPTLRNLSVGFYSNGFTQWVFRAPTFADVLRPGYFDPHATLFKDGDHMTVLAADETGQCAISKSGGRIVVTVMVSAKLGVVS